MAKRGPKLKEEDEKVTAVTGYIKIKKLKAIGGLVIAREKLTQYLNSL